MELKKTNKANLEKSSGLRIQLGIILVVSVVLFVMQYDTKKNTVQYNFNTAEIEFELELNSPDTKIKLSPPLPSKNFNEIYSIINDKNLNDTNEILIYEKYNNIKPVDFSINEYPEQIEENIVLIDRPAEFPGGKPALKSYLKNNLQYPAKAKENNIQGSVLVRFTIDEKGNVKDIDVIGKVHNLLDNEAVRLIKNMPEWKPAFIGGEYSDYKIVLPINFMLENI